MKPGWILLVAVLGAAACSQNQREHEQILKLADRRVSCDSLTTYLQSQEPRIRTWAVAAMGQLQDTTCLEQIQDMLDDLNHNVRIEAAFALGQLGDPRAENALIERL
ncbi:MAG: HEAT repeat domain-containing protein, partial [Calditrichaeota bacterium]